MKKQRRKYSRPLRPWEKDRMDAEDKLLRKYGLARKEEIWKTATILRGLRRQARCLLTASGKQAELETEQLLSKLRRLGLVAEGATLDDVLGLTVENLLERRLQTLIHRKGLAKTPRQARQLVIHGHIAIAGDRVDVPGYLVSVEEEGRIGCTRGSSFAGLKETPPTRESREEEAESGEGEA